jgi:hypothetical protein
MAVSFIGGGNLEYLEKTTTCRKSLANISKKNKKTLRYCKLFEA